MSSYCHPLYFSRRGVCGGAVPGDGDGRLLPAAGHDDPPGDNDDNDNEDDNNDNDDEVEEDTLETGLDGAYTSFNSSAASFLEQNTGLDSSGPASKLVLKFFIALWCGLIGKVHHPCHLVSRSRCMDEFRSIDFDPGRIYDLILCSPGALFTFPGLRVSRMHWDVLRYSGDSARSNLVYHINHDDDDDNDDYAGLPHRLHRAPAANHSLGAAPHPGPAHQVTMMM